MAYTHGSRQDTILAVMAGIMVAKGVRRFLKRLQNMSGTFESIFLESADMESIFFGNFLFNLFYKQNRDSK
jgi:hypothetical protein